MVGDENMPGFAEYSAYTIRRGFDALGERMNNETTRMKNKAKILAVRTEMRKLAQRIGEQVIVDVASGIMDPIVSEEHLAEARELLKRRQALEGIRRSS